MPIPFPETETGVEISLLKRLFDEKEQRDCSSKDKQGDVHENDQGTLWINRHG